MAHKLVKKGPKVRKTADDSVTLTSQLEMRPPYKLCAIPCFSVFFHDFCGFGHILGNPIIFRSPLEVHVAEMTPFGPSS